MLQTLLGLFFPPLIFSLEFKREEHAQEREEEEQDEEEDTQGVNESAETRFSRIPPCDSTDDEPTVRFRLDLAF